MATSARERGRLGEEIAALLLASRGYVVVARNRRAGRRELDLIVERGALLVAVEVKWRHVDARPDAGARAWSRGQRARQHEAVLQAMAELPGAADRPWRFDLVVIAESARGWRVEHHAGAWSPGASFW